MNPLQNSEFYNWSYYLSQFQLISTPKNIVCLDTISKWPPHSIQEHSWGVSLLFHGCTFSSSPQPRQQQKTNCEEMMHYLLWSSESKSIRGSSLTYTHTKKQVQQLRPWLCNNEFRVELHGHFYKWKWHQEMTVDRDRSTLFSFFGFLVPVKRQANSTKCITTSLILYQLAEFEKTKNSPQRRWPAARFRGMLQRRALIRHRRPGGYLSMLEVFWSETANLHNPKVVTAGTKIANLGPAFWTSRRSFPRMLQYRLHLLQGFLLRLNKEVWKTGA